MAPCRTLAVIRPRPGGRFHAGPQARVARPDARRRERFFRPSVMVARLMLVPFMGRRRDPGAPGLGRFGHGDQDEPPGQDQPGNDHERRGSQVADPGDQPGSVDHRERDPGERGHQVEHQVQATRRHGLRPRASAGPGVGMHPQHEPEEPREGQVHDRHRQRRKHATDQQCAGTDGDLDRSHTAGDPIGGRPSHVEERLRGGTGAGELGGSRGGEQPGGQEEDGGERVGRHVRRGYRRARGWSTERPTVV